MLPDCTMDIEWQKLKHQIKKLQNKNPTRKAPILLDVVGLFGDTVGEDFAGFFGTTTGLVSDLAGPFEGLGEVTGGGLSCKGD